MASFNPRTPGGVRLKLLRYRHRLCCFNPRTPGGVRQRRFGKMATAGRFQSTHPGWGATRVLNSCKQSDFRFNPRTPGGVRRLILFLRISLIRFNPRTPGGVRHQPIYLGELSAEFQSTHPGWGATSNHNH